MATIKLKNGSGAPLASDLVQGEPALDLTNKRLYTEDAGGAIIEVGTNPSSITTSSADIDGGSIDGTVIGGVSPAAVTTTALVATTADIDGGSIDGAVIGGVTPAAVTTSSLVATTADIDGGSIDGSVIGGTTPAAGSFTTFTSTGIDDNAASTAITIDGGQNVGIGATTVDQHLHVEGAGTQAIKVETTADDYAIMQYKTSTSSLWQSFASPTDDYRIGISGTGDAITINSSLNVGIGTSSPTAPLSVEGSGGLVANINDTNANGGYVRFQNSGTSIGDIGAGAQVLVGGTAGDFGVTSRSGNLVFGTNTAERMRLDASGNVGIGTTLNSGGLYSGLNVRKDATGVVDSLTLMNSQTTGAAGQGVRINMSGVGEGDTDLRYAYIESATESTSNNHYIAFGTNAAFAGPTEAMRIDSSGNFMVGATSAFDSSSFCVDQSGLGQFRRDGTPLLIRRDGTDGALISFEKDGASVGSIGVLSNRLYIGSGDTGLKFSGADDLISPIDASTGTGRDGLIDLGSTGARFKDLHLSGTARATQVRVGSALSAASPDYTFQSDSSMGMFRLPGVLGFSTVGAEAMRIDASGNVGIGESLPSQPLHVNAGNDNDVALFESTDSNAKVTFKDSTSSSAVNANNGNMVINCDANNEVADSFMAFRVDNSEKVRIDTGGNLLVGKTAASSTNNGHILYNTGEHYILSDGTGSSNSMRFYRSAEATPVIVGSITTTGTATSYNTSSDYRLKENVVPLTGAMDRVKQLKPSRFNFINDADTTVDGFIAHEVQEVIPEAATGSKDAMQDEEYEVTPAVLDDDGNVVTEAVMGTRSVPDYQGIDQSKIVPLLVAAIQELEARLAAIESN